ncbi:hypothetical protein CPC08DRAFT_728131 [Agrocybe pediades]|nr:hypothetical protein CPC08DRAFT_728131 [Agrocybe pediades]
MYRKYNDGLTKQQRYVQRNKQKVYEANAKYKRERRAKLQEPRERPPSESPVPSAPLDSTSAQCTTPKLPEERPLCSPEFNHVEHHKKFKARMALENAISWQEDVREEVAAVDNCWDMNNGWWSRSHQFEGSWREKVLYQKYKQASKVKDDLVYALTVLHPDSWEWDLTVSKLQDVSADHEAIKRTFKYFYLDVPNLDS